MKIRGFPGLLISIMFLFMTYFYTRELYNPLFIFLIALLVMMAFFKESQRVFSWIIISIFIGTIMMGYADHFIGGFHLSPYILAVISQVCWLIPIGLIMYVLRKFHKGVSPYITIKNISTSLGSKRTWRYFYISVLLGFFVIGIIKGFSISAFFMIMVFSSLNALQEEFLWRGILLPQLAHQTNQNIGLLVGSISYASSSALVGLSPKLFFTYIVLGFFFGLITTTKKNVYPSIALHLTTNLLLIEIGWIVIPGI